MKKHKTEFKNRQEELNTIWEQFLDIAGAMDRLEVTIKLIRLRERFKDDKQRNNQNTKKGKP